EADTARPLAGTLRVVAPGAQILIDGRRVGTGEFRADTMSPGAYTIAARVETIPECRWSAAEEIVRLTRGTPRTIELDARACGRVRFARAQSGTRYRLTGAGGIVLEDVLPTNLPIVVPAGRYELVLTRAGCDTYGP